MNRDDFRWASIWDQEYFLETGLVSGKVSGKSGEDGDMGVFRHPDGEMISPPVWCLAFSFRVLSDLKGREIPPGPEDRSCRHWSSVQISWDDRDAAHGDGIMDRSGLVLRREGG